MRNAFRFEFRCVLLPRIACLWLIIPVLLAATTLAAQQNGKHGGVSLTIDLAPVTLNVGQTQTFSTELTGAPAATMIAWVVREKQGGNISQEGVFTPKAVGIYHIVAFAIADGTVLTHAVARVAVQAQYDGPVFRYPWPHVSAAIWRTARRQLLVHPYDEC